MTKTTMTNLIHRHPLPLHPAHPRLPLPQPLHLALPRAVNSPSQVNTRRLGVGTEVGFDKGCPAKLMPLTHDTLTSRLMTRDADSPLGYRLEDYISLRVTYVRTARYG